MGGKAGAASYLNLERDLSTLLVSGKGRKTLIQEGSSGNLQFCKSLMILLKFFDTEVSPSVSEDDSCALQVLFIDRVKGFFGLFECPLLEMACVTSRCVSTTTCTSQQLKGLMV